MWHSHSHLCGFFISAYVSSAPSVVDLFPTRAHEHTSPVAANVASKNSVCLWKTSRRDAFSTDQHNPVAGQSLLPYFVASLLRALKTTPPASPSSATTSADPAPPPPYAARAAPTSKTIRAVASHPSRLRVPDILPFAQKIQHERNRREQQQQIYRELGVEVHCVVIIQVNSRVIPTMTSMRSFPITPGSTGVEQSALPKSYFESRRGFDFRRVKKFSVVPRFCSDRCIGWE